MAGPFKMKGSPMQRNFGIESPVKQDFETLKRKYESLKTDDTISGPNRPGLEKKKKERSKSGKSFDTAFRNARDAGKSTFTWNGKSYSTKTREEETKKSGGGSYKQYLKKGS